MKRFILVRYGNKSDSNRIECRFPNVRIHDTSELVDAEINGRKTRVYKPVSEIMHYLDAHKIMNRMNKHVND